MIDSGAFNLDEVYLVDMESTGTMKCTLERETTLQTVRSKCRSKEVCSYLDLVVKWQSEFCRLRNEQEYRRSVQEIRFNPSLLVKLVKK